MRVESTKVVKKQKGEDIVKYFFKKDNDSNYFQCQYEGCNTKRKANQSFSNLKAHLKEHHPNWERDYSEDKKKEGPLSKYLNPKGTNIFKWMDLVIKLNLPFSYVEDNTFRQYSNLTRICAKTLKASMHDVAQKVEKIISNMLPEKFAMIFDGWDGGDTKFVGIHASFMKQDVRKQVLLAFSPMDDETSQTAEEHVKFINSTLLFYGKSLVNVACFIGDNCSTNKKIARLCERPLVGCFAHILNLAVKKYVFNSGSEYAYLVQRVTDLMEVLKTQKGAAVLRSTNCKIKAIRLNDTRWTSGFRMLERCIKFRVINNILYVGDRFLNACEANDIKELTTELSGVHSVMLKLQAENLKLSAARKYFDVLLDSFPQFRQYLTADSSTIHKPDFTTAIVKIQSREEMHLNAEEKKSVELLLKGVADNRRCSSASSSSSGSLSERLAAADKEMEIHTHVSSYINLDFIVPTSNCVQRLFSQAKRVFRPSRQSLLPYNFEAIMFLKANRGLWDIDVVCDALVEAETANEANELQSENHFGGFEPIGYSFDDSDDD